MSHELTKMDERELHQIAREINEREKVIESLKGKTESMASQAVNEAILQGRSLAKAKARVPHGDWSGWLAIQCPLISDRTARRYMALAAKWPHVADLKEAESLRAALALCDMEGVSPNQNPAKQTSEDMRTLDLFTRATKYISDHPLDRYPPTTLDEIRRELEPTAKALWPERFV